MSTAIPEPATTALPWPPSHLLLLCVPSSRYKDLLDKNFDALTGDTGGKTKLQNIVMQLRKAANHPYLFDGVEDRSADPNGAHLWENAAKTKLLDKLLPKLKAQDSRVLIFSQMTRLLDILQDYCDIKRYNFCRIDGSCTGTSREDQIDEFNKEGSEKFIFLLSTRAGGQ